MGFEGEARSEATILSVQPLDRRREVRARRVRTAVVALVVIGAVAVAAGPARDDLRNLIEGDDASDVPVRAADTDPADGG